MLKIKLLNITQFILFVISLFFCMLSIIYPFTSLVNFLIDVNNYSFILFITNYFLILGVSFILLYIINKLDLLIDKIEKKNFKPQLMTRREIDIRRGINR